MVLYNVLECVIWLAFAGGFLLVAVSRRDGTVRALLASATFALFAGSDAVELLTGAGIWWRPWWLLAWKAFCVITLLALYADHVRRRQQRG